MMLTKIAQLLDKSPENEAEVDDRLILNELNIEGCIAYDKPNEKLKCYWLSNWKDTYDVVGQLLYLFDGVPVATSLQNYRKETPTFQWISYDLAKEVRNYYKSLLEEEELFAINLVNPSQQIPLYYSLHYKKNYNGQKNALYLGEPAELLNLFEEEVESDNVEIRQKNGSTLIVPISDLAFPINIGYLEEKNPLE